MNDEARMSNDEGMTTAICVPGVIRDIVTSLHRVCDLTIQHLNDLTSRSHSPIVCRAVARRRRVIRHL
jgi:hypothetical protein